MQEIKLINVRFLLWPDVALATLIGLLEKMGVHVGDFDWNAIRVRGGLQIYVDASSEMDDLVNKAKRRLKSVSDT